MRRQFKVTRCTGVSLKATRHGWYVGDGRMRLDTRLCLSIKVIFSEIQVMGVKVCVF